MTDNRYPILQFDPALEAIIEPADEIERADAPQHCVLCFHREVVEDISLRYSARIVHEFEWESACHRVFQIDVDNRPVVFLQPGIGAPLAAGLLEGCIALDAAYLICFCMDTEYNCAREPDPDDTSGFYCRKECGMEWLNFGSFIYDIAGLEPNCDIDEDGTMDGYRIAGEFEAEMLDDSKYTR